MISRDRTFDLPIGPPGFRRRQINGVGVRSLPNSDDWYRLAVNRRTEMMLHCAVTWVNGQPTLLMPPMIPLYACTYVNPTTATNAATSNNGGQTLPVSNETVLKSDCIVIDEMEPELQSPKAWIKDTSSGQNVPASEIVNTNLTTHMQTLSDSEARSELRISGTTSLNPTDKTEQTMVKHFSPRSLDVADEPPETLHKRPSSMNNWIECASCGLHVQASDAVGAASCSTEPVRICLDSETRPELSIPCSTCISFAAQVGQRLARSCPSRGADVVTEPLSTAICRPPSMNNWIECASCGLHVQASDAVGAASCSTEPVRICLDSETRPELSIPCSTCISFAAQVGQRLARSCPSRGADVVTEPLSTAICSCPPSENWNACSPCEQQVLASELFDVASSSMEPDLICSDSGSRTELSRPSSTCTNCTEESVAEQCSLRSPDMMDDSPKSPECRAPTVNNPDTPTELITIDLTRLFSTFFGTIHQPKLFSDLNQVASEMGQFQEHSGTLYNIRSTERFGGDIKRRVYTCTNNRHPLNRSRGLRKRPSLQTGCHSKINICLNTDGLFRITKVCMIHNHRIGGYRRQLRHRLSGKQHSAATITSLLSVMPNSLIRAYILSQFNLALTAKDVNNLRKKYISRSREPISINE
ncbi:hypothetical protein PHET_07641 [Paragonimus heterotremus]|uniref:FAR1 domain-containing protein n=1 Tax=Paragonimus heterotremus TaxID=100268 RepID=A0A8J4SIF0_9TREM|nr:hypothetical protein PHET_07641 [Paragonimus heterotremus]